MRGGGKERLCEKALSGLGSASAREEVKVFRGYNRKEFVFLSKVIYSQPRRCFAGSCHKADTPGIRVQQELEFEHVCNKSLVIKCYAFKNKLCYIMYF